MEPLETAAWLAVVAEDAADGEVTVRIPRLAGDALFGPCPYMPRATATDPEHPEAGDRALVTFDDRGDPWVVMWRDG